ncbi:MAG: GNAT family N-acetyltransferase, partial [Chloroflexaceae bacterium]|nr:GNAT family N-acetyltransferase [Chloroflexaceae bacterium]
LPDGTIAGIGHFFSVNWLPEPGTYWTIVRVRPDVQRRGIGTALLQHMQAELAALGAHTMWLMVPEEAEQLLPVFERRGFRECMRTNPFVLDVAACPPLDLDSRLAKLGSEHGLRVSTLRECMAEDADWLDKVYALHAAVTREVPLPEKIFITREEFAEFAVQSPQALFDAFFVVRDGDAYVGLSFMQCNDETPDTLYQELTGNLPAYRGKGLARILKLLTIDYALRHGYQKIVTWMENNNAGMLAINLSYGFVRETGLVLLERPVSTSLQLPVGSWQQFTAESLSI